jgi:hypothetical protein
VGFVSARHSIRRHVTVFGSTSQYSAACHSIRQHVTLFGSMSQYSAARHTIRQHVTVFGSTSHYSAARHTIRQHVTVFGSMSQYSAACHSIRHKDFLAAQQFHWKLTEQIQQRRSLRFVFTHNVLLIFNNINFRSLSHRMRSGQRDTL